MQTSHPDNHLNSVGPLKLVLVQVGERRVCCSPGWLRAARLRASDGSGSFASNTSMRSRFGERELSATNTISPNKSFRAVINECALTLKFEIKDQP